MVSDISLVIRVQLRRFVFTSPFLVLSDGMMIWLGISCVLPLIYISVQVGVSAGVCSQYWLTGCF